MWGKDGTWASIASSPWPSASASWEDAPLGWTSCTDTALRGSPKKDDAWKDESCRRSYHHAILYPNSLGEKFTRKNLTLFGLQKISNLTTFSAFSIWRGTVRLIKWRNRKRDYWKKKLNSSENHTSSRELITLKFLSELL